MQSLHRWLPVTLWAASIGAVGAGLWLLAGQAHTVPAGAVAGDVALPSLAAVSCASVGALLAVRRPRNPIGWLLLGVGCAFALSQLGQEVAVRRLLVENRTGGAGAAIGALSGALGSVLLMPLATLAVLFPTGRPPAPRWRFLVWLSVATPVLFFTVSVLFDDHLQVPYRHVQLPMGNPFFFGVQVPSVAYFVGSAGAAVAFIGACAAVIGRWRASRGAERQQLKVLMSVVTSAIVVGCLSAIPWRVTEHLDIAAAALLAAGIPLATAVAILRYRLYDIDRLVSRTVTYAAISAVLTIGYLVTVVVLRAVLRPVAGESGVAVAISTLVMAAAFQPVRRRVQTAVDQRFNRARYDAARVVDEFRSHVRREVDLDEVCTALVGAVRRTVEPTAASLWLRPREWSG